MEDIKTELKKRGFKGELDDSTEAKEKYSHDASMFELRPKLVVMPEDSRDVQTLIGSGCRKESMHMPELSVTARIAGTDMAGGAINESIIVDFNKHLNKVENVTPEEAQTQPGVFYRDFEKETLKQNALMPIYPASRELCTVGGMVANNSGGEKSLEYGKVKDFVNELSVVFADGNEYVVKPLKGEALHEKAGANRTTKARYTNRFMIYARHTMTKSKPPNRMSVKIAWAIRSGKYGTVKLAYSTSQNS